MHPERRAEIGRSAWMLLHSLVYSVKEDAHLSRYKSFATQLLQLYPCGVCRARIFARHLHWLARLSTIRFAGEDRTQAALALWAVEFHNAVNQHLGRSIVDAWNLDRQTTQHVIQFHHRTYADASEACLL